MSKVNSLLGAIAICVTATAPQAFEVTSPDIANGGTVPQKFVFNRMGCTGANVSPALAWSDPPAGTRSFAVLVHDPDAPTGGAGFWHWVVIDIPANAKGVPQGAGAGKGLPAGSHQITTDFGTPGYGGPCPPVGDPPHHYNFTVYALKVDGLQLPPHPTASLTGFMVNMNALGKATLVATYGR